MVAELANIYIPLVKPGSFNTNNKNKKETKSEMGKNGTRTVERRLRLGLRVFYFLDLCSINKITCTDRVTKMDGRMHVG